MYPSSVIFQNDVKRVKISFRSTDIQSPESVVTLYVPLGALGFAFNIRLQVVPAKNKMENLKLRKVVSMFIVIEFLTCKNWLFKNN